jgi:PAS domain S-box-containing protein
MTSLRESEARSLARIKVVSDVVYRMSADGREMRFLVGRRFVAGTRKPTRTWLQAYIPREDRKAVLAAIDRAIRRKSIFHLEHRVRRADGRIGWAFSWAIPILDARNEIVEWYGIASDITRRKAAEAAVHEDRDRLSALVRSIRDEVWYADAAGRFTLVNPRGRDEFRLLARSPASVRRLARSLQVLRPDGSARPVEESPPLRALRGETVTNQEEIIRTPATGELRYRQVSAAPVHDVGGRIVGSVSVVRDITDRKRAEEALCDAHAQLERRVSQRTAQLRASEHTLAASEERFRQMAENMSEVFWLADAGRRRMLYVSPAFETVWGRPCAELYRNPRLWVDAVHPEDRGRVRGAFFRQRGSAAPLQAEYRIVRPDGTVRWIADHGAQVRDKAGRVYRIAGVARDITESKNVELTLVRTDRALRAITACNETLLRSTSEQELYDRVCRVIVETGGYRMAWIGLAEEGGHRPVRPVACAGKGRGYLSKVGIVWSNTPRGRGPTGTAIRTGRPSVCRNIMEDARLVPWRRAARRLGYGSSLALPLVADDRAFGALNIYAADPMAFEEGEIKTLEQLASDVAYGVSALRLQATRQRLERQLLDITEREQRRIGQDVHDTLGQRIASARLTCAAVAHRLAKEGHHAAQGARRVERELAQALEETRHIARGLHPVKPGPDSLMSALSELAANITKLSRIPCRFVCPQPVLLANHAAASHLYRIAQESANNAVRHARASQIRIKLAHLDGRLRLRIEDDGRGLRAGAESGEGLGLQIMRYRSSVIGARLSIASRPNRGTTVTCELPPRCEGAARGRGAESEDPHASPDRAI